MTDTTIVAARDVTLVNVYGTTTLTSGQSITVSSDVAESLLGSGNFNRVTGTSVEIREQKKKRKGE
jgi:hypothetical protein